MLPIHCLPKILAIPSLSDFPCTADPDEALSFGAAPAFEPFDVVPRVVAALDPCCCALRVDPWLALVHP